MPAFSGLWDGVHGQAYSAMPKSNALPPAQRGIVRVLMQGRGMHGHVSALGRNAPATIAQVNADLNDLAVRGGYDYANRQEDAGNQVTITNVEQNAVTTTVAETKARPTDATEADMAHTYDTTLRNGHPADSAGSGVTSPAVAEDISDGS